MEAEPLQQGAELMLAGMGTVFVFLTALVAATTVMSMLVKRFTPEPELAIDGATDEEVAAISAAIAEHRRQRN